mmetsp:Transcript_13613/g.23173  ORF Transcript_13613/g.23173 Transcript_13613/m.23173 type:complete len:117 (+) Transcript_13613:527-877(+)
MEPNYIFTHHSAQKGRMMEQKLNDSPQDKHKAMYGETNQANYLISAKDRNSESKMFNDRTNAYSQNHAGHRGSSTKKEFKHDAPVSPFRDMSGVGISIRDSSSKYQNNSPVKTFNL